MAREWLSDRMRNENILNDSRANIVVVNIILIYSFNLNKSKVKIWVEFLLIVVESAVSSFVPESIYADIFGHIRNQ